MTPSLSFHCRHRYADGFQLDVAFETAHRFTAVFGPSGSGKSSVLSVIAGLLRPQEGQVTVGKNVLFDTKRKVFVPPERRCIGFIFQDSLLFPHLSVKDNLLFGRKRRRSIRPQISLERVTEALEIGPLLNRSPATLSGGERQRIALGRAVLSEPELLVMDEPLASLDDSLKDRVLRYVELASNEWNLPTIYVTHGQVEVRRAAQWVVMINNGSIVAQGTPEDVLTQPSAFVASNSGAPVNLLRIENVFEQGTAKKAKICDQELLLPSFAESMTPHFVQFRPGDVMLARQDATGVSARNHLRGRIRRMLPIERTLFVAVDVGQILWAEITPQAAEELRLAVGDEIFCLLKTNAIKAVE